MKRGASASSSPTRANAARAAPLFAALGDERRLRIVSRLCSEGPLSATSLTEGTRISRQAISKHLRALSEVGIIVGEKSGRECLWQLRPKRLDDVLGYLEQISGEWDRAIERLRAFVEDEES